MRDDVRVLGRLGNADEPWDMALILWTPDFVDPYAYINRLLDAQPPAARTSPASTSRAIST